MTKSAFTVLITLIIFLLMLSAGTSIFFNFNNNYKIETWAVILSIISVVIVVANKEKEDIHVSINIPEDAIKININLSGGIANNIATTSKVNLPTLETDTRSIPKWKDVKVGEISLQGEKI